MHRLSLAFLFCLLSCIVNAEQFKFESKKTLICDRTEAIVGALSKDYGEYPFWTGHDTVDDSYVVLMLNTQTGTWTMLQYSPKLTCIIGSGDEGKRIGKIT
jgi:hypothetical protein